MQRCQQLAAPLSTLDHLFFLDETSQRHIDKMNYKCCVEGDVKICLWEMQYWFYCAMRLDGHDDDEFHQLINCVQSPVL